MDILVLFLAWPAVALNLLVLLEALLAYHDGFFWPGQTKRRPGRRISFFVQHPGMWGDFIYISPLTAALYQANQHHWTILSTIVCWGISAALSSGMVIQWTNASSDMDDAFSGPGRPKACGIVHAFYMFAVIPQLVQFFWFNPVHAVSEEARAVAAILLMAHVVVGVIFPDRITDGYVKPNTWLIAASAWAIMLVSWLYPYV